MGKILVFLEHSKGKIKRSSLELLSAAKNSGQEVMALALGSQAKELSNEAASYGASQFILFNSDKLDQYNPELYTSVMVQTIKELAVTIVLAPSSSLGKDLFPRVSAKLDAACVSDCINISFSGDKIIPVKPLYSGKCNATVDIQNTNLSIVLMRANQIPLNSPQSGATIAIKEMNLASVDLMTQIKEIVKGASEKLDLTEANIIISGGRGLKEASNFKLLNDLADVLGATVGATRAVVDAGWVSHGMQVGQTGKTVAPTLYIAVGISGAIQHLAGMTGSKVIVAINNDPNAPIFQKSTYGIVGDLFEILPKLTEEFKKVIHH